MKRIHKLVTAGLVVAVGALAVGCGSDKPNEPSGTTGLLTFKAVAANANGSPSARDGGGQDPMLAGAVSAVQITSARVVISRIRVKSVLEDTLDFNSTAPRIVDLDLSGVPQDLGTIALAPGDYDRTIYRLDELDSLDGAIYQNNPDMQNLSVRIEGYVNGSADSSFVWSTDLDEQQVFEHTTPFTVNLNQETALVFTFDASGWFVDSQGAFIDPRDVQNKSLIENNIKNAFDIEEEQQATF